MDAMHTGEKFLRRNCAVERLAWGEAIVASFTRWLCIFFAKISEQSHAPAVASLGVMNHLLELSPGDSRFGLALFVDEMELFGHVACAEQQHAFAWQPVPARAPGLLVVALQIFRQIIVHDKPDVRFINAHSERNGRGDHANVVPQERVLIFCALGTR